MKNYTTADFGIEKSLQLIEQQTPEQTDFKYKKNGSIDQIIECLNDKIQEETYHSFDDDPFQLGVEDVDKEETKEATVPPYY